MNAGSTGATSAEGLQRHLLEIAQERDAAYQALQEREAELTRIQRIGRVGGVEVDLREGFRNRRSPEYLLLHGLPPEAANESHQDWVNRIHPDDREVAERQFIDAIAGDGEDYTSEYRIIRPSDGEVRWIRVVAKIDRDTVGRAIKLVGAHIDVTDRMLAQETLRESEERFRLIANSAPVPIWVTKLDRTRLFANKAYVDFLGLPYEEAIKYDWRKALHPDDLQRILNEQIEGESSLQPFVLEARYKRTDGEWRWLRSESQPRWDPNGKHIGFIGVAHDVTVAKQAEIGLRRLNETLEERIRERTAQLEASEARMRAILESSHQYQFLLSPDGALLYANTTALAEIETEATKLIGIPFWDAPWFAKTEGMPEAVRSAFARVIQGENVRMDELRLELASGERFFDFTMRPVFNQHGQVTGAVPEAVDITERRQSEEALRQSHKMEAIGQLTGGVAHDFNNLLTIVRSATDFLRRRDLPDERRRRYVDAISETVERGSKLTTQLLAFARRQPLKPETFNVSAQVEALAQLIRPLVGSRIRVETNILDSACFAMADLGQFETALINFAVNGRDAMLGEGRLILSVRKVASIPPLRGSNARFGAFVAVAVQDTGEGIAPEHLTAIFEPFFTTKEVGKGTGLGLSQAFGFAKQSDGDISVVSELGQGATFTIYLPQATAPSLTEKNDAVAGEPRATGRGHFVLVVDDNEEVGRFSAELLEDLGYGVRHVSNAKDALALLGESDFAVDLVFSDIIMPGMNGIEFATLLRDRYPGLPVVLTTGYSNVLAENADCGFELIKKPYSVELLSRVLRKSLASRHPSSR